MFGGKGKGVYVPMTEIEQEVVARLVEQEDLVIGIKEWGTVDKPRVKVGDHRVGFEFTMTFSRPEFPVPVHFFDLELKTRSGTLLFAERQHTLINGSPIQVAAGMFITLQWDIALSHMDPAFVKRIKPDALGLTSKVLDRNTGKVSLEGNMRLTDKQKKAIAHIRNGQRSVRLSNKESAQKVTRMEEEAVRQGRIRRA